MAASPFTALLLLAAVVTALLFLRVRPTERDLAWLTGRALPLPDEALVAQRYLARLRLRRLVGGIVGAGVAVALAIRWTEKLVVGIGASPVADPLFLGLGGVIAGALVAESFRVPRRPGRATASLTPRDTSKGSGRLTTARAVMGAAVVAAVLTLIAGGERAGRSVVAAALGLLLVGLAELGRRRVLDRRRPALSPRAARLDVRLRGFATVSLGHLELAAASLSAAWVVAGIGAVNSGAAAAQTLATLVGIVVAVVQLRLASPRPPRGWLPGDDAGLGGDSGPGGDARLVRDAERCPDAGDVA